ncbi:TetR/AcrR family transcriptional regulator [Streptomyces sp. NBC_01497]|uniref:TetR/AcrR family transcriptional regulator n=1 Tax=Streptomyces sp. NBC_01497 TaxID=2903885 RepID=UPI002E3465F1|nr:TetR/AcrR family transcriptional regulator [Streptomyces sp. NBC_01497]
MRYSKGHKEKAKAAILTEASRSLKENGFHGVGVDALASAAKVTSGALYSNFANKEALFEEVVSTQLGLEFAGLADTEPTERRRLLGEILRLYLSDLHRKDPANGCVMPSLSSDVARSGDSVRDAYRRQVSDLVAVLAPALPGAPHEQEAAAWSLVASIVGAITVARALPAGAPAQAVLDATLETAMRTIAEER